MVACSLPDTKILRQIQTLPLDSGMLISFAIKRLHFTLDWSQPCCQSGGKLQLCRPFRPGNLGCHTTGTAEADPMVAPRYA